VDGPHPHATLGRAGLADRAEVGVVFANLSAAPQAAVDDNVIARNPCRAGSVKLPKPQHHKVVPWTAEQVAGVAAALPERYAAAVTIAAGLGLRQCEVLEASGRSGRARLYRQNGMHALRRYFASVLLEDGVSIKAVATLWVPVGHVTRPVNTRRSNRRGDRCALPARRPRRWVPAPGRAARPVPASV
jgi:integrase